MIQNIQKFKIIETQKIIYVIPAVFIVAKKNIFHHGK